MAEQKTNNFQIDATGRAPGRVATEVANLVRGKTSASFAKNIATNNKVVVSNASKMKISPEKKTEKKYVSYTGYPGGKRETPMAKVIEKHGYKEVLRKAIYGMLPGNKLRAKLMKQILIKE